MKRKSVYWLAGIFVVVAVIALASSLAVVMRPRQEFLNEQDFSKQETMEGFLGEGNSEETEFIISKTFIRAFSLEEAIALEQETIAEIRQKFMNRSIIMESGLAKGTTKPLVGEVAAVAFNDNINPANSVSTGFESFNYQNTSNNTWYDCRIKVRVNVAARFGSGTAISLSVSKDGQNLGCGQLEYFQSTGTYIVTSQPFDMEPNCIYNARVSISIAPVQYDVGAVKAYITDINLE